MQDVVARRTEFRLAAVFPLRNASCRPAAHRRIALSNVTVPGPRYLDHRSLTDGGGFRSGAFVPLVYFSSSDAQSVIGKGFGNEVVRFTAAESSAIGPWILGPVCSNCRTGGVLPAPISLNGFTT
jgi:hypothetical protein